MIDGRAQDATSNGRCVAVALCLSLVHILTFLGIAYQNFLFYLDYTEFVNFSVWLAPAVALLLLRRICILVATLAVPVLIAFGGRAYYVYLKYSTGTTYGGGKGDWALWLTTLTGAVSIVLVALWILYRITMMLVGLVSSRLPSSSKQ